MSTQEPAQFRGEKANGDFGVAPGPSVQSASVPRRQYKSLDAAATALRILFAAIAVLACVGIAFRFQERSLLNDPAGTTFAEAEASDDRIETLWGIVLVVSIVTAAVFIFWFHRAYRNLEVFARDGLRFSRGWAIGAWFIPLANLVLPKLLANDLWRGSDPHEPIGGTGWSTRPVAGFVHVWWGALVVGYVLSRYADGALDNASTIDEAKTFNLVVIFASACVVVAAACAYLLVTRTTQRQESLATVAAATKEGAAQ